MARLCLVASVLSNLIVTEAFVGGVTRARPVGARLLRTANLPYIAAARPDRWTPTMEAIEVDVIEKDATDVIEDDAAAREVRSALTQTVMLVALAFCFCTGVFVNRGPEAATSWLTAYVLEQALSVDNLLVFTAIFDYFKTPIDAQPRVLRWGLIVAAILRAGFIFAGLAVVERFKGVLLIFAGVLLYTSAKMMFADEEEEEDLSQNAVVQWTKHYLPSSDEYDGERFITSSDNATTSMAVDGEAQKGGGTLLGLLKGTSVMTPLLLTLVCVEISDVIFAVDSIPAVFGVTKDPFIAFTSNGFAILGLRALYPLVARAVDEFKYLTPAVALVLAFIGGKLIVGELMHVEVSTITSLAVVASTLVAGVGASIFTGDSD
jgi:TerC family integral membrane protein